MHPSQPKIIGLLASKIPLPNCFCSWETSQWRTSHCLLIPVWLYKPWPFFKLQPRSSFLMEVCLSTKPLALFTLWTHTRLLSELFDSWSCIPLPCDIFCITSLLNSYDLTFQVPKQLLILSVAGTKCYTVFEFSLMYIRVWGILSQWVFIGLKYLGKGSELFQSFIYKKKYDKFSVIFV